MTVIQIDDLARHNLDPGEDNFTMLEAGLYWHLRRLYERYKASAGEMTVDDAKAEKARLFEQYEAETGKDAQIAELTEHVDRQMRILRDDDRRRVALAPLIAQANKTGCALCREIARVYDGRK